MGHEINSYSSYIEAMENLIVSQRNLIDAQRKSIEILEKRLNTSEVIKREKRMMAVTVALCFAVLLSTLFGLFTH